MAKVKQKQPITLRYKELKNGRRSLYLDYYVEYVGNKGKNHSHQYEFLKLYLVPDKGDVQAKRVNEATMKAAEAILAQRLIERANNIAHIKNQTDVTLFGWFTTLIERVSEASARNYKHTLLHIKKFSHDIPLHKVDKLYCESFARFMSTETGSRHHNAKQQPLAPKTIFGYYSAFVSALNEAVRAELIPSNPADRVDREIKRLVSEPDPSREFLTLEEVDALAATPCSNENVKSAFMFACYCGLRISDITKLRWADIRKEDGNVYYRKMQTKTKKHVHLPLPQAAQKWLPEKGVSAFVFDLPRNDTLNKHVRRWVKAAGIDKYVTFHTSRHTFATSLLTLGADLYTTSKLLGHKNINTTQIYADIIDAKKVDAVNLFDKLENKKAQEEESKGNS